ncbi:MAG: amidase, putative [Osedax symbiont Rs1]|nr:MAG: amidase, putative [Osedax symbiont Rs1]
MKIKNNSLSDNVSALAAGEVNSVTLVTQALKAAENLTSLNAIVSLNASQVLAQAIASDRRRAQGIQLSPIDGIPIAVKDNFLTKDYPTTACSNTQPLKFQFQDATIVSNLRAAGAVIFAKTNMHEWAFGATNSNSNIGPTCHPYDNTYITGGSSGGSAAAVSAGIVCAALGSDTGGSVRIPSSACGVYGFKPSYGRSSRYGVLPLSWSLDAPGPIASSLQDIEYLLPYFLGPDDRDTTTLNSKKYNPKSQHAGCKLVHLIGPGLERSEEIDAAVKSFLSTVKEVREESLPNVGRYFVSWETILHAEAAAYHSEKLNTEKDNFSDTTRIHLTAGMRITAVQFLKAQRLRAEFCKIINHQLGEWDALVVPTLPVAVPKHDEQWQVFSGRNVSTQDSMTWFCWLGNLAGLPCVSIPIGTSSSGLPIGVTLMGKPGKDEELLALAKIIEKSRLDGLN